MKQTDDGREIKGVLTSRGVWFVVRGAGAFVPGGAVVETMMVTSIKQYYEYGKLNYAVYRGDWMEYRATDVELVWYGREPSGN